MIGLRRHTVRVVDHEPSWSTLFAGEWERLHHELGDLAADIQHVGSTAVPDLPAKPILDIAIAIGALDLIPDIVERLTGIGYIYRGDGGHLFVKESEPDICTVHLHVVELSDAQWKNYLLFRKILHDDAFARKKYAGIKIDLAKRFPDDRKAYTSAKDEFIRGVLREANMTTSGSTLVPSETTGEAGGYSSNTRSRGQMAQHVYSRKINAQNPENRRLYYC